MSLARSDRRYPSPRLVWAACATACSGAAVSEQQKSLRIHQCNAAKCDGQLSKASGDVDFAVVADDALHRHPWPVTPGLTNSIDKDCGNHYLKVFHDPERWVYKADETSCTAYTTVGEESQSWPFSAMSFQGKSNKNDKLIVAGGLYPAQVGQLFSVWQETLKKLMDDEDVEKVVLVLVSTGNANTEKKNPKVVKSVFPNSGIVVSDTEGRVMTNFGSELQTRVDLRFGTGDCQLASTTLERIGETKVKPGLSSSLTACYIWLAVVCVVLVVYSLFKKLRHHPRRAIAAEQPSMEMNGFFSPEGVTGGVV